MNALQLAIREAEAKFRNGRSHPCKARTPYTFVDLFAGVGGFHLALADLGMKCVAACENNPQARQTYAANFDVNCFPDDITHVDPAEIPDADIICGGFPCQPFSIAGTQAGFAHAEGNLFFNVLGIIQAKRPRVVLLENVKNLLSHDHGRTFTVIRDALVAQGYTVKHQVLDGLTHGNTPQHRERIFLACFRNPSDADAFVFPDAIPLTTTLTSIVNIHVKQDDRYYYHAEDGRASTQVILNGVVDKGRIYQFRRAYIRPARAGTCPTLTANMGEGGNNVPLVRDGFGVRKLTPRECFLLQGFPTDFVLPNIAASHLYKQAGNSIVVPVARRIVENIVDAMTHNEQDVERAREAA